MATVAIVMIIAQVSSQNNLLFKILGRDLVDRLSILGYEMSKKPWLGKVRAEFPTYYFYS